jgi:dihydroorotase-like cyclic amidohydrolase
MRQFVLPHWHIVKYRPMHFRTQIKNATIINEGRQFVGTLVIDDDRIDEILEGHDAEPTIPVDESIDGTATCCLV